MTSIAFDHRPLADVVPEVREVRGVAIALELVRGFLIRGLAQRASDPRALFREIARHSFGVPIELSVSDDLMHDCWCVHLRPHSWRSGAEFRIDHATLMVAP